MTLFIHQLIAAALQSTISPQFKPKFAWTDETVVIVVSVVPLHFTTSLHHFPLTNVVQYVHASSALLPLMQHSQTLVAGVWCVDVTVWNALCFSACNPGRFGPFCTQTCSCPSSLNCDRFTGDCVCESGGDDCKQGTDTQEFLS